MGKEITKTKVFGWEAAFRGLRNPMNSHNKADSYFDENGKFIIGPNDMNLALRMARGGAEERKFLRMIHVQCDINMPRFWWSEADTYIFKTQNSTSTMHRLLNTPNPITVELFESYPEDIDILKVVVNRLETLRLEFRGLTSNSEKNKLLRRAKALLPEGFLQLRTYDTNYEQIYNMYMQRKHHRLKEDWIEVFCAWAESLPWFAELCLSDTKENE